MWCGHQVKETDRNLFTQDAPIWGLCSISHGNYYLRVAIIAVYFLRAGIPKRQQAEMDPLACYGTGGRSQA